MRVIGMKEVSLEACVDFAWPGPHELKDELTQLRREAAAFRWAAENGHLADLTSRRLDGTMETPLEAIEEAAKEWE